MTGLKAYTDETKDDAFAVVRARFSESSCRLVEKYLHNPICKLEPAAGDVAYQDDRPVGFQAAILRRMYRGRVEFVGTVGGMLGMLEGASPVLLMKLMKQSIASRGGSSLFFANTSNATSMKMNRMLGIKGKGPETCERVRFACAYWPSSLKFLMPRPAAKRLMTVEPELFDDFWRRYLATNEGVVCSRSAAELDWAFGDRLVSGEVVLLGSFQEGKLQGYIAAKRSKFRVKGVELERWMIVDWVAVGNDGAVLKGLLRDALRYLRRETKAVMVESVGFPSFAEPILARYLPFKRKCENNSFIYQFADKGMEVPEGSWFFGPYDGDRGL